MEAQWGRPRAGADGDGRDPPHAGGRARRRRVLRRRGVRVRRRRARAVHVAVPRLRAVRGAQRREGVPQARRVGQALRGTAQRRQELVPGGEGVRVHLRDEEEARHRVGYGLIAAWVYIQSCSSVRRCCVLLCCVPWLNLVAVRPLCIGLSSGVRAAAPPCCLVHVPPQLNKWFVLDFLGNNVFISWSPLQGSCVFWRCAGSAHPSPIARYVCSIWHLRCDGMATSWPTGSIS